MKTEPVLYEKKDKIGIITLNRPENRNSMHPEIMTAFRKILEGVKEDSDLRCLIITGSGSNFCSGADFKSGLLEKTDRPFYEVLYDVYQPFMDIQGVKIPVIAAMNGHAVGGGLGLALLCDIRVANGTARFGANFARLGLHSGMCISYILPRLVGLAKANELLFTGRIINGEDALGMGLVNYATAPESVMEKSMELAVEIAQCAPVAVRMLKRSVLRGLDWDLLKTAEMEAHIQSRTFEMEDADEGIKALLEKRIPDFKGK